MEALTYSQQDYLKNIYKLSEGDTKPVRLKDIAKVLNVTPSTARSTVKTLQQRGLLDFETYGYVLITNSGIEVAKTIISKYEKLVQIFHEKLNLDKEHAEKQACKIEHAIDDITMDRLSKHFSLK